MAGTRIPCRRSGAERRRVVTTRFPEINECIDGACRNWPNELSQAGAAPCSIHKERRVDDSRKIPLLRHRHAAAQRSNSSNHADGLAFLVEETNSPTRERLRAELEKTLPGMRWCVYEPFLSQGTSEAAFGTGARVIPRFDRADIVLALDSDFLDCGQGDLAS